MSEKSIYELGLHESIAIDSGTSVARVPGGWIYTWIAPDASLVTSNFVPWHDEYQVSDVDAPRIEPHSLFRHEAVKHVQSVGFKNCADENGIPCGKADCLSCACPF